MMQDWAFGETPRIPNPHVARDPVTEPEHYSQGAVEVIDVIMLLGLDPCAANVLKYVSRHRLKGGKDDLRKAARYIELMLMNYDRWYRKDGEDEPHHN